MAAVTTNRVVNFDDWWRVPISGYQVRQVKLDYSFGLDLQNDDDKRCSIRINTPFIVNDGKTSVLASVEPVENCISAISFFGNTICNAAAYKNGRLVLGFVDGRSIIVEPHDKYEAWEIRGESDLMIVASPGGSLAIWQPTNGTEAGEKVSSGREFHPPALGEPDVRRVACPPSRERGV